jgi:hypothetical protein
MSARPAQSRASPMPTASGLPPRACTSSSAPRWSRTSLPWRRKPDLAIGTTPLVQDAKQRAIPALYFTNLISARPLMGAAGAGSLVQVVNAAIANKARFDDDGLL